MPSTQKSITLSVVVPAFNAAQWLSLSLPKVGAAIRAANITKAEIIIVNDGSTDDTTKVARSLELSCPVRIISQKNSGRFIARCKGVDAANYEYVLLIDTRVFINKYALKYIVDRLNVKNDVQIWSSHVHIDKKGNLYARFWDAITFIAWRKYFANPRDCSYGIKDFDHYPKGTTCFFAPKEIIQEANSWFKQATRGMKASNDDTLLIRHMAETHAINLSPHFSCTYHARTSLKQFAKHTYHRGKVFVDGFLRRDGNRFFYPLVGFLILSVALLIYLIVFPQYVTAMLILAGIAWVLELLMALLLKVSAKDALSLFILSPLFVILYGSGIWAAVPNIFARKARSVS